MIGTALFVASGILFALASHRRERAVPQRGTRRPDHTTGFLMVQALCAATGAITVAVVHMITFVS